MSQSVLKDFEATNSPIFTAMQRAYIINESNSVAEEKSIQTQVNKVPEWLSNSSENKESSLSTTSESEIVAYLNSYMITVAFPEFLRYFYKMVLDTTIEVNVGETEVLIETLDSLTEHSIYLVPSVNILENATIDCYQTAGITDSSSSVAMGGLQVALLKRRVVGRLNKIDVFLYLSNGLGRMNINCRVWRATGLSAISGQ